MKKNIFFLLGLLLFFWSCQNKSEKREQAIQQIQVPEVHIDRFDQKFADANPEDLPTLKRKYPYLFPKRYTDSVWIHKMRDSLEVELHQEVTEKYPELDSEEKKIRALFQHIKYYFPKFKIPEVIAVTSDVDYAHNIVVTDKFLLISLDTYLGKDHKFYKGIQVFLRKNFRREAILSDIVFAYGKKWLPRPKSRNFLATMVYYGKILYLKDRLLPHISDGLKIGYTPKELQWAKANEGQIWRFFVEKELLFNTDNDLEEKFINEGPYTKFGLQLDSESPAQLGQYIGWHIVRQFMNDHPDVSLKKLIDMEAATIFNKSNYKPKNN